MKQYDDTTLGLPTRYSPNQLTSLLMMALRQGDYTRANEIMKFAKDHLIQFDAVEFNELVKATLSNTDDDGETAWKLLSDASGSLARYSYITYLNYMISDLNKVDFDKTDYIYRIAKKSVHPFDRNFWDYWHTSYFKYILRELSVKTAIKIFDCQTPSYQTPFKTMKDFKFELNPFTSRTDKVRLNLSNNARIFILRDIFQSAFKNYTRSSSSSSKSLEELQDITENFKQIGIWCFIRLKQAGLTESSIIIDLTRTINRKKRKHGFTNRRKRIRGSGSVSGNGLPDDFLKNVNELKSQIIRSSKSRSLNV
ncbi:hypothetical protein CANARDRAFT_195190 [[Candida] arabinofermentans NRRL YB-2248]|uniref:Uncharacterized protein n=1 Tax=[Candida] arabinofermentans NRRL YB-2248 TaxID=983967 RepID=A0A1E4T6N1_9ASCO|nr:hypothetical protein CANARDRAFT_195190 [[Candida] arabinofermentans NRRL YB-2248]